MDDRFRFRAWDRKERKMVAVDELLNLWSLYDKDSELYRDHDVTVVNQRYSGNDLHLIVDRDCDLMQSTGLRDKNGTLIYEGDVVKYLGYEVQDGKQVRPERFRAVGQTTYPFRNSFIDDCFHIQNLLEHGNYELEIIGNIYSNPDLVKG